MIGVYVLLAFLAGIGGVTLYALLWYAVYGDENEK